MGRSEPGTRTREPAVAGLFYPEDEATLRAQVADYLATGRAVAR